MPSAEYPSTLTRSRRLLRHTGGGMLPTDLYRTICGDLNDTITTTTTAAAGCCHNHTYGQAHKGVMPRTGRVRMNASSRPAAVTEAIPHRMGRRLVDMNSRTTSMASPATRRGADSPSYFRAPSLFSSKSTCLRAVPSDDAIESGCAPAPSTRADWCWFARDGRCA